MKRILLLTAFLSILTATVAQKEANFWYFGDYAGVSFGLGVPIALIDGQLSTGEGCSSISTSSGNLLFYTDGTTVWNKIHLVMENGTGLHGHSSSTQSGLIVPNPSNSNIYYIFTVDARDNNLAYGLQYSVVDMSANGGLGRVDPTQKNIPLIAPACEKVTAVGNQVGNGFWVITHQWNTNSFYAFQILGSGVNTTPVISSVGAVIAGDMEYSKGYIKVSPDGEKLAIAHNTLRLVEIFDFNTASGVLNNPISDPNYQNYGGNDPGGPYGVEFSPDSKKLYIGEWKVGRKIFQYDMEAGSPTQILNSRVIVASVGQSDDPIGALQIGPDNRMYIARRNYGYLSRINFPNTLGTGCTFEDQAVYLAGRECTYGLPPFIQSFFNANVEFFYETPVCLGDTTQFYLSASVSPDSVFWNFGDFASGDDNYSTELNPRHLFTDTLIHFVTLTYYLSTNSEIILHGVIAHSFPNLNLGNDSTFCYVEPYVLDAGPGYYTYLWQNGATSQSIVATTSGTYWCEVTNTFSCPDRDSIILVIGQEPVVEVTADEYLISFGTSTGLHGSYTGGQGPFSYQWTPSDLVVSPNSLETQTQNLISSTTFFLHVTDESAQCTGTQGVSILVTGGPLVVTATASNTQLCPEETTQLNALPSGGTGNYSYLWSSDPPGFISTLPDPVAAPLLTTTYIVRLADELDTVFHQVTVTMNENPVANAGLDFGIPYGSTTILQGSAQGGSGNYTYAWGPAEWLKQTNIQNPETKNLIQTVQFELIVTDAGTDCVSGKAFVTVTPQGGPLGVVINSETPEICQHESSVLTASAFGGYENHYTYTWNDENGTTYGTGESITVTPDETIKFYVTVFDQFNYESDEFEQIVYEAADFTLAGGLDVVSACPYDTVILVPWPPNPEWSYLWSNGSINDTMIVGSTGIGFDIKSFTVWVETPNGCQHSEDITVMFDFGLCNGTEEFTELPVGIFPNPGKGTISIEGPGDEQWQELTIYNINARRVHYEVLSGKYGPSKQIRRDFSFLPPGIYFVELSGNGLRAAGKLVILP